MATSKNHFHHPSIIIPKINSNYKEEFPLNTKKYIIGICPNLARYYMSIMTLTILVMILTTEVYAVDDMWTVANTIIVDVYTKIAGISTVLAGLMSAVAVVGAKLSNNQHKVDQAWDWLKRIWIAWAIINGIGAFIAYIAPLFTGLATLTP